MQKMIKFSVISQIIYIGPKCFLSLLSVSPNVNKVFGLAKIWGNAAGMAHPYLRQTTEKVIHQGQKTTKCSRHGWCLQSGESHAYVSLGDSVFYGLKLVSFP